MKKYLYIIVLLHSVFYSCGRFSAKETKPNQDERIVCVSKQYNEIIFTLRADSAIVGVDLTSTYPEAVKKLPTVGYHRALSAEAILALKPTLILHDNNIGPDHVVKQLTNLKIPMKTFGKYSNTMEGTDSLIREIGSYFHRDKEADSVCNIFRTEMIKAIGIGKSFNTKPRVLVIHFGQASNSYLVMTKHSTAAKLIEWAGGEMAVEDEKGMKQISAEVVAKANPDIILLTDFGYDRLGSTDKIKELPGVSITNAFKNNKIFRVEEHDLVYLGPRSGSIIMAYQALIHPDEK